MKDKLQNNTVDLAGRYYETEDYNKEDQLSSGLATTHEQASDAYMEGEIKAIIEDVGGKNIEIPRQGYEEK
ncbi:YozQ family protein [Fredinandcohnia humi]